MPRMTVLLVVCGTALALYFTGCKKDQPPTVPDVSGPMVGKTGATLSYTFSSTDPENQEIAYAVSWGDSSAVEWSSTYASGEEVTQTHSYPGSGVYVVKVKARDTQLAESEWSDSIAVSITGGESLALFQRTYGGSGDDEGNSVQQTSDGGYVIAGWTSSLGAGNHDMYVIKTDPNGDTVWTRTIGGAAADEASCVRQTSDGGYVAVGQTQSFGAGSADVWLVRLNALGETLWTRTYGGSSADVGYSVVQTTDAGFVVAGYSYTSAQNVNDALLIKTDRSGNVQWSKTYGDTMYEWASSVRQTPDGGYVFTGYKGSRVTSTRQVYVVKTNAAGDTQWTRAYGGAAEDRGYCVELTGDGGYVVAGMTRSYGAGSSDFYLLRLNSAGDTLWTRTFGASGDDEGYSVTRTSDNGFLVAGTTTPPDSSDMDVYLVKVNASGATEWTRTYDHSPGDDAGNSVQTTSDGGIVIAGYTNSPSMDHDVYLLKTDANGSLGVLEQSAKPQAERRRPTATAVRSLPLGTVAFDAMGRRVVNPRPGVYFVRERPAVSIRKVVVTR